MQVAVEKIPMGILVIGVDCDSIQPIDGAFSVRESIRVPKCKDVIKKLMAENGCGAFDLVLLNGYTGIGGTWLREAINQNALVFYSVKLATQLLLPRFRDPSIVVVSFYVLGNIISYEANQKVSVLIQGILSPLYLVYNSLKKLEVYKPKDSFRGEFSAVKLKYKAPAKIDPGLLSIELLLRGKEHRKSYQFIRRYHIRRISSWICFLSSSTKNPSLKPTTITRSPDCYIVHLFNNMKLYLIEILFTYSTPTKLTWTL